MLVLFLRKGNVVHCCLESSSFQLRWVTLADFNTPSSKINLEATLTWSSVVSHSVIVAFFPRKRNSCNNWPKKSRLSFSLARSPVDAGVLFQLSSLHRMIISDEIYYVANFKVLVRWTEGLQSVIKSKLFANFNNNFWNDHISILLHA